MNYLDQLYSSISKAFISLIENIISYSPRIIGALLILLLGFLIAKIVAWLLNKLLLKLKLDNAFQKTGLTDTLKDAKVEISPSSIVSKISFWIIMLTFILAAFDSIGLEAVGNSFQMLLGYLPNLFIAVILLALGLFLAQVAKSALLLSLGKSGVQFHKQISTFCYYAIIVVTIMITLEQLRINISVFENFVYILFGVMFLFGGLVLAWGARDSASNIVAGYQLRKLLTPGCQIKTGDVNGTLENIRGTHSVIVVSPLIKTDAVVYIPNSILLNQITSVDKKTIIDKDNSSESKDGETTETNKKNNY